MQEVQTSVNYTPETRLQTIEAVGTSSRKIIEGRQTTGRYLSWCTASWERNVSVSSEHPDSWYVSQPLSITDSTGKMMYSTQDWGVKVPVAWTYQITATWPWKDVAWFQFYLEIRAGNNVIISASNSTDIFTASVDLGNLI